jgi:hypothetical protein
MIEPIASRGCWEGLSAMTFPDILSDPLIRAVMVADQVDPEALRADLVRIAWGLQNQAKPDANTGLIKAT